MPGQGQAIVRHDPGISSMVERAACGGVERIIDQFLQHDCTQVIRLAAGLLRQGCQVGKQPPVFGLVDKSLVLLALAPLAVGAILLEQNDEWAVQRGRYMTLETM